MSLFRCTPNADRKPPPAVDARAVQIVVGKRNILAPCLAPLG